MADILSSVETVLNKTAQLEKLSTGQVAALRATITKLLEQVDDDELKGILLEVQAIVGERETASYQPKSADDYVIEYEQKYRSYSMKQRGAFKAKVSRSLGNAKEAGDEAEAAKLQQLLDKIVKDAEAAKMRFIKATLKELKAKSQGSES
jgi:hypothetical protein